MINYRMDKNIRMPHDFGVFVTGIWYVFQSNIIEN